jgi:enoyl-CoA hydratase/carnithine racemase
MAGLPRIGQPGLFFATKSGVRGMPHTMFRLERHDDCTRLILDRPAARNAIPAAGWSELSDAIGEAETGGARMLIVTGAHGTFCAGADLDDLLAMRDDKAAIASFRADMRGALDRLRALCIPTVALIEGHCYGAGVALALACDIRIASLTAEFAITPAKIGISYPQEDVHRLVALVGPGQAARMLFSAQIVSNEEALRIGLVETRMPGGKSLFDAILANDPESLTALKQAIAGACEGVRSDPEADRRFNAMIAGDAMARRLEALRRK